MKVKELINKLQKYSPEAEVVVDMYGEIIPANNVFGFCCQDMDDIWNTEPDNTSNSNHVMAVYE